MALGRKQIMSKCEREKLLFARRKERRRGKGTSARCSGGKSRPKVIFERHRGAPEPPVPQADSLSLSAEGVKVSEQPRRSCGRRHRFRAFSPAVGAASAARGRYARASRQPRLRYPACPPGEAWSGGQQAGAACARVARHLRRGSEHQSSRRRASPSARRRQCGQALHHERSRSRL